jgi:hypothetical protein
VPSLPADAGHQRRNVVPASACFRTYTSPFRVVPFMSRGVGLLVRGRRVVPARRAVLWHGAVEPGLPHRPDLFLVGSTSLYVDPAAGVGGSGSPFTTVTSFPAPPRGPIC